MTDHFNNETSKKSIHGKENYPDWKRCEITKRSQYSEQGCLVIPTGKGSDFLSARSEVSNSSSMSLRRLFVLFLAIDFNTPIHIAFFGEIRYNYVS